MADVHSKETRSYNMSQIRAKNTKPEIMVRKYLFSRGLRFRIHDSRLPGKPDIVLPKFKTVIFVHGCFWHGHENCRYYTVPKTRTEWWIAKIGRNQELDRQHAVQLGEAGWQVMTIFECELKPARRTDTLIHIFDQLTNHTYDQHHNHP